MLWAETTGQTLRLREMSPIFRQRARLLFFLLSQLLIGSALRILQRVEDGNGLEGWRQLNRRYGAASGTNATRL